MVREANITHLEKRINGLLSNYTASMRKSKPTMVQDLRGPGPTKYSENVLEFQSELGSILSSLDPLLKQNHPKSLTLLNKLSQNVRIAAEYRAEDAEKDNKLLENQRYQAIHYVTTPIYDQLVKGNRAAQNVLLELSRHKKDNIRKVTMIEFGSALSSAGRIKGLKVPKAKPIVDRLGEMLYEKDINLAMTAGSALDRGSTHPDGDVQKPHGKYALEKLLEIANGENPKARWVAWKTLHENWGGPKAYARMANSAILFFEKKAMEVMTGKPLDENDKGDLYHASEVMRKVPTLSTRQAEQFRGPATCLARELPSGERLSFVQAIRKLPPKISAKSADVIARIALEIIDEKGRHSDEPDESIAHTTLSELQIMGIKDSERERGLEVKTARAILAECEKAGINWKKFADPQDATEIEELGILDQYRKKQPNIQA